MAQSRRTIRYFVARYRGAVVGSIRTKREVNWVTLHIRSNRVGAFATFHEHYAQAVRAKRAFRDFAPGKELTRALEVTQWLALGTVLKLEHLR